MRDEYSRVKNPVLREILRTKATFVVDVPDEDLRWWQRQYDFSRGMGVDVRPDWGNKKQTVTGSLLMCLKYLGRAIDKDNGFSVGKAMQLETMPDEDSFAQFRFWIEESYPRFFEGRR